MLKNDSVLDGTNSVKRLGFDNISTQLAAIIMCSILSKCHILT